jgi:hypothetical protein
MPWSARFRQSVTLTDGRVIKSLSDARALLLSLPVCDQRRDQWQQFAALLVTAAKTGNAVLVNIAGHRLAEVLRWPPFTTVGIASDYEPMKKPPAPSVRRRRASLRKLS